MKTKDSLSIFAEAFFFWSLIVFMVVVYAFYVGEKMGRESVACPEPLPKTDTLYIRKERICEQDCYTGAVECQEFVQPVRSAQ